MVDFRARYHWRALRLSPGNKPLDFGAGGINGSVNYDGRITALNAYHPAQGYVTLTAEPPFPESQRYNPQAVRAYRASLVHSGGFGLAWTIPILQREAWLIEDAIPCIRLTLKNGITAETITFVPTHQPVGLVQWWRFSEAGRFATISGRVSLQRCAYTQLTEGGPIPMPPVQTRIAFQQNGMVGIENPALGWAAVISAAGCIEQDDGTVALNPSLDMETMPNGDKTFLIGLGSTPGDAATHFQTLQEQDPATLLTDTLDSWRRRWQGWRHSDRPLDREMRRGLVYGLNCCIPTGAETTCIITDHQLLPLSWNRDAYYVALALLHWQPEMGAVVRRHLIWMFEIAERPAGTWGRSYLVNGRIKDPAFQLDQQLFPLLELVEYIELAGDYALWSRLRPQVMVLIRLLLAREKAGMGLFATDETPADDPVVLPYHLSSHILLWHTFRKLAVMMSDNVLVEIAERVYRAVRTHFTADHDGRKLFAYLTDGSGKHHFYHDANDLPLALAPVWGFCPVDDPIWQATMDFAFSAANQGGYYPGLYGGLGSVHTPNTWPLGDVQAYLVARLTGDHTAERLAVDRLEQIAQVDGALPEAYYAQTGQVVSRHWFSWPNAALIVGLNITDTPG